MQAQLLATTDERDAWQQKAAKFEDTIETLRILSSLVFFVFLFTKTVIVTTSILFTDCNAHYPMKKILRENLSLSYKSVALKRKL